MKERTLRIPATGENLDKVLMFLEEQLEEYHCSMKLVTQLQLAVEEVFINIAHYAYADSGKTGMAEITLGVEEQSKQLHICFRDSGVAFDPLKQEEPDITTGAEERKIGGLGIFLVKKIADEVTYKREDSKNVLRINKKLENKILI